VENLALLRGLVGRGLAQVLLATIDSQEGLTAAVAATAHGSLLSRETTH
jgi:hypothetical protein